MVGMVGGLVGEDGPAGGCLEAERKAALPPRRHLQVCVLLREAHGLLRDGWGRRKEVKHVIIISIIIILLLLIISILIVIL